MRMKDFLVSPEFDKYRKKQLEKVVGFLQARMFESIPDVLFIAGALEMARIFIRLPEELTTDKTVIERIQQHIQEDLNRISIELVRGKLGG